MCWKQEWAMAVANISHAIEHIEKAKTKLTLRLQRNKINLPKSHDKENVQILIQRNSKGIEQCEQIIANLKEKQDQLFRMIHEYGINHSKDPKRVYALMGKYPFTEKLKEFKIQGS